MKNSVLALIFTVCSSLLAEGHLFVENHCSFDIYVAVAEPRKRPKPTGPTMGYKENYYHTWGWILVPAREVRDVIVHPHPDRQFLYTRINPRPHFYSYLTGNDMKHCVSRDRFSEDWDTFRVNGEPACSDKAFPLSGFQRTRLNQQLIGTYLVQRCGR